MSLTLEEKACNYVTMQHIGRVRELLNSLIIELLRRGEQHDRSKLEQPEVAAFTVLTPKLKASTYGIANYEELRK